MNAILEYVSKLDPRARRGVIMLIDVLMVLIALPLSLLLSLSHLSFDPFSLLGLLIITGIGVASHLLFRFAGFYNTVWRFASTPDFFNIISSCGVLTVGLYLTAITVRAFTPVTGLNERQFIAFFLFSFMIISLPRLVYRYLREGAGWRLLGNRSDDGRRRALFIGTMSDADIIIRFTQADARGNAQVIGIMATGDDAIAGTKLHGVPILAAAPRLADVLDSYAVGTGSIDLLILGRGPEGGMQEFAELVRVARDRDIRVVQFAGFSRVGQGGGMPILEAVDMETVLRRATVATDTACLEAFITGRRVLVTGGAGSIGRTMVKRCLNLGAEAVLVVDASEFGVFKLINEVGEENAGRLTTRILDIVDKKQLDRVVAAFRPDIMFHAAALKHVPLLEENWVSAIKTNVFGTLACAEDAARHGVGQFVLISSDKAADPTSILGLTKRAAEQIVNAFHFSAGPDADKKRHPIFTAVRFGNVFGSDGSVATVFEKQIMAGGPVTITDPSMTRYMMTIGEAIDLVIMAAADAGAHPDRHDCSVYMLDMGNPVSILDLAETMIRLSGRKPHVDIPIVVTGVRPGEKLHESLSAEGEQIIELDVPSVFGVKTGLFRTGEIRSALEALRKATAEDDKEAAFKTMNKLYRRVTEGDSGAMRRFAG